MPFSQHYKHLKIRKEINLANGPLTFVLKKGIIYKNSNHKINARVSSLEMKMNFSSCFLLSFQKQIAFEIIGVIFHRFTNKYYPVSDKMINVVNTICFSVKFNVIKHFFSNALQTYRASYYLTTFLLVMCGLLSFSTFHKKSLRKSPHTGQQR